MENDPRDRGALGDSETLPLYLGSAAACARNVAMSAIAHLLVGMTEDLRGYAAALQEFGSRGDHAGFVRTLVCLDSLLGEGARLSAAANAVAWRPE